MHPPDDSFRPVFVGRKNSGGEGCYESVDEFYTNNPLSNPVSHTEKRNIYIL